jgi:hypothetical protein
MREGRPSSCIEIRGVDGGGKGSIGRQDRTTSTAGGTNGTKNT